MSDFSLLEDLFRNGPFTDLAGIARRSTVSVFGNKVFLRGLIEYSNHCTSNCLYCGIRRENQAVRRYRMNESEIYNAVDAGYARGIKTFVLQGGEDAGYGIDKLGRIVSEIRKRTDEKAAITLSCGILGRQALAELKRAGADRYLIRFETSDPALHQYLRDGHTLSQRLGVIEVLRELGYQIGSGFMVGLPGETENTVVGNVQLCKELRLDMAGIGPFIPHPETPLADSPQHSIDLTLRATAFLRAACPETYIPATTAAGSLVPDGRERMIRLGANVVMPNLTPSCYKKDYLLYPGKICLDESGLHCIGCLGMRIASAGGEMSFSRADGLVSCAPKRGIAETQAQAEEVI